LLRKRSRRWKFYNERVFVGIESLFMNRWRYWLDLIGGIVNVVGIVLAVYGVMSLKKELFPPGFRLLDRVTRPVKTMRHFLGALGRRRAVDVRPTAGLTMAGGGSAKVTVELQLPNIDTPQADWNQHFMRTFDELRTSFQNQLGHFERQLRESDERRKRAEVALSEKFEERHDRLLTAVAGKDGSGLDLALGGLFLGLLGTALQFAAGFHLP
jgi:hypothetical protein